jgi:hypothetical protein
MWLIPDILDWPGELKSIKSQKESRGFQRPYQMWRYAEDILQNHTTNAACADAVATLKRVVDYRVRALNDIYKLETLPVADKPAEPIELLEYAGIIKPLMRQTLQELSAAAEYTVSGTVEYDTCLTFLEFAWYFLGITDRITGRIPMEIILRRSASYDVTAGSYEVSISVNPESGWVPEIKGLFNDSMVSAEPIDTWIALNVKKMEPREHHEQGPSVHKGDREAAGVTIQQSHNMYMEGQILGPDTCIRKLLKIYFHMV